MLTISEHDRVVSLRAPDPAVPGASQLGWRLIDACRAIQERDQPLVAVVLHAGEGAFFIAPPSSAADCWAAGDVWAAATRAVAYLDVPTVAVIAGDAIGPAWELALACDLRLAAAEATVGSPELTWGAMPAAGGTQRLVRAVGQAAAIRLLLLGEILSGSQAHAAGLVHRCAPRSALDACLVALLDELRAAAPTALAYVKEAVRQGTDLPLERGLRLEADLAALLQTTHDRAEGVQAFLERRPPRFRGA